MRSSVDSLERWFDFDTPARGAPRAAEREDAMRIEETVNEGLKRSYRITITEDELANRIVEKLAASRPDVEMKGFRKGKAPIGVLRQKFGQRALSEAINETLSVAVTEQVNKAGGAERLSADPRIERKGDDGSVFELHYELMPDVPNIDYSVIRIEKPVVSVGEDEVDERLRELATRFEDKGAAAEDGDQLVIDFSGKIDGKVFDGGERKDYELVLGAGASVPGFEEQLVGLSTGDRKVVEVSLPDDYPVGGGGKAVLDVTVKAVRVVETDAFDDELAKKHGSGSLDALKSELRGRLEEEYASDSRFLAKLRLFDVLEGKVTFDLPPTMLEDEAKRVADTRRKGEGRDGGGSGGGVTDDDRKSAERRLKIGFLIRELGTGENILVSDEDMERAIRRHSEMYPGREEQFMEAARKDAGIREYLQALVFEEKVADHMFTLVTVDEKVVPREEWDRIIEENADGWSMEVDLW